MLDVHEVEVAREDADKSNGTIVAPHLGAAVDFQPVNWRLPRNISHAAIGRRCRRIVFGVIAFADDGELVGDGPGRDDVVLVVERAIAAGAEAARIEYRDSKLVLERIFRPDMGRRQEGKGAIEKFVSD